jgi:putative MFS transporter
VWRLIVLLSLGGSFEMYDLFQTAYLSPGLISSGVFRAVGKGLFGLTDQAAFAAATFTGLLIGTSLFSSVADRFGRRAIFTFSLLWYTVASVAMGSQRTYLGVDLWRLVAGIGIGVELVTIDAYISEPISGHPHPRPGFLDPGASRAARFGGMALGGVYWRPGGCGRLVHSPKHT